MVEKPSRMFSVHLEQLFCDSGAHEVPRAESWDCPSICRRKLREECSACLALHHRCLGHASSGETPSLVHAGMAWIDAPAPAEKATAATRPQPQTSWEEPTRHPSMDAGSTPSPRTSESRGEMELNRAKSRASANIPPAGPEGGKAAHPADAGEGR